MRQMMSSPLKASYFHSTFNRKTFVCEGQVQDLNSNAFDKEIKTSV